MAGIGKYKKGARFTLKSGNKIDPGAFFKGEVKINPSQESGIYYKSPLEKDDSEDKEEEYDPYNVSGDKDEDKDEKEVVKPDTPGTKAWKVAANALIGGFDAITGERTKRPKINFGKHEEEVKSDSPESKVNQLLEDQISIHEAGHGNYEEYLSTAGEDPYSKEEWTKLNLQNVQGSTTKDNDDIKLTQEEKDEGLGLFEGQRMSSAEGQFDYSDAGKGELTDLRKKMKKDGSWDVKNDPQAKAIQNKINELYGDKTKH